MSKINKLLVVLLSVIFCFSAFSLCAFAVGENEGEGGYSDVITDDNQGGGESGGDYVEIPPENSGSDSDNSGYVDDSSNTGDSSVSDDNGSSDSGNTDYNYDSGYSDSDSGNNSSDYNYDYSDSNDYSDDSSYYDDNNYYDEPSYLGGGQTYVEPENIAPSASLYDVNGSISDKTLNSGDWSDISERLKNASNSADDGDDFAYIQNNNSSTDNGSWMLIVSVLCFVLSAAGILYFIVLTVQSKKNGKYAVAASSGKRTKSSSGSGDYYGDGYRASSAKRTNKSSKFDTAEVTLPKNTSGKRYKNNGRRYK